MQQMAETYATNGYIISIVLESKVCVFKQGNYVGDSCHNHTIARYIDFSLFQNIFFLKLSHLKYSDWQIAESIRCDFYREIFCHHKFSDILVWNGTFDYQQSFLKIAKNLTSHKLNFMEVAWFDQKDNVYIDPLGVNGDSLLSITRPPELSMKEVERVNAFTYEYTKKHPEVKSNGKLKVLVPLQVDTDSNIINHSPFKSMLEFITFLENWLPKDNIEVIIRAHPKAKYEYELKSTRTDFIVDTSGDIKDKIANADIIIGINSTVLLQSLAFYKGVIAFGDGIFNASSSIIKMDLSSDFTYPKMDVYESQKLISFLAFSKQIPLSRKKSNSYAKYFKQCFNMLCSNI
jgi:hypothetical protein